MQIQNLGKYEMSWSIITSSECLCQKNYYLPRQSNCRRCPIETSICTKVGLIAPPVAPGFWRYDHSSDNVAKIPFYLCPNKKACLGGNDTMQRCALGYDNANPLCATCVTDYILVQGQKCYPCPGAYNNGAEELSIELVFAFGTGWFIGFIIFVLYFFSPSKLLDQLDAGETVAVKTSDFLVKLKIFIGFMQCFSLFPFTFDIPWSTNVLEMMKYFEVFSLDFFSLLGETINCKMQTRFLQTFQLHMLLPILIFLALMLAYALATCTRSKTYSETLKTRLYTSAGLIFYTLSTGLATRIFRLFKCKLIQEKWYLVADYTQVCFETKWNSFAIMAGVFGVIYVVGIPITELLVLFCNRSKLYEKKNLKTRFGSFYLHYKPAAYYFDVLDLARRLLLTGGLIMMGGESVAQIFLGIVVCAIWVIVLAYKETYHCMDLITVEVF